VPFFGGSDEREGQSGVRSVAIEEECSRNLGAIGWGNKRGDRQGRGERRNLGLNGLGFEKGREKGRTRAVMARRMLSGLFLSELGSLRRADDQSQFYSSGFGGRTLFPFPLG
jgi:hypothetical protein